MNLKDCRPGTHVYHGLFTHYGKGIVVRIDTLTLEERLFEGGRFRVVVSFEGYPQPMRLRSSALRKTPNRKKIRDMVDFHRSRGDLARDGGDRLIVGE